jgi:methylthioribose-1-phosphate isomerase
MKEEFQQKLETIKPIKWDDGKVVIIDQTALPEDLIYESYTDYKELIDAIKKLKVRGAPAIGIAGAYALVLALNQMPDFNLDEILKIADEIISARPTAVNLSWAVSNIYSLIKKNSKKSFKFIKNEVALKTAINIHNDDIEMCKKIGVNGNALIKNGMKILTHCNAGILATGGMGTALSVIYTAFDSDKNIKVFADETRPLLQGSRLTAWELNYMGVDTTVICDNMAAWTMKTKQIGCIIVGADRIAANGDTANKIGTYGLSILAKEFDIPFYVAAPSSTLDLKLSSGNSIIIEERGSEEIIKIGNKIIAPENINTFTPAFDVTPAENINAIITEKKVHFFPFKDFEE